MVYIDSSQPNQFAYYIKTYNYIDAANFIVGNIGVTMLQL